MNNQINLKKSLNQKEEENALKRKKSNYINLEPILTKVGDLSVNETDLDDILIDINDEKTKKDVDRNGEKISYKCSFTSEGREEGMVENGTCEEIGDAYFSFDNESGKLVWMLNAAGSTISEFIILALRGVMVRIRIRQTLK